MIFELDNVEFFNSEKPVLNGIYLKAETGKITGILGKNGGGKSCVLRIFFGSLKPHHKLVRVDGKPYLKPFFCCGNIKFLPQTPFIPPSIKLSKAFKYYNVKMQDFFDDFPQFKKYETARIRNLSGGEERVIEIYLVLRSESKLVLLDEPFTHLAPAYIEQFKKILKIEKSKKAIVITDHMYRHILDIADDLYLLKNGYSQLLDNPKQLEDYKYLNPDTLRNNSA